MPCLRSIIAFKKKLNELRWPDPMLMPRYSYTNFELSEGLRKDAKECVIYFIFNFIQVFSVT